MLLVSRSYHLNRPLLLGVLLALACAFQCSSITLLSRPTFTPATNAPLAGSLRLTTDVPSRLSITVTNAQESWTRNFYDYSTNHAVPVLGCKPGRTNTILVTAYAQNRNQAVVSQPVSFITGPLPSDFPTNVVFKSVPEKMEPGYTLFRTQNQNDGKAYLGIVDSAGNVV